MTELENISDTALWVAAFRAHESIRADRIIDDPFAARLAGERGERLARTLPSNGAGAYMALRTRMLDDLILRTVAENGLDMVVNLAAGLDSRPYRLDLPGTLRWVEVDLPEMVAYKEAMLAEETPRCRLERVMLDLADARSRSALFARLGAESRGALVITEGLLIYLRDEDVRGLAADLQASPAFRAWAADVTSAEALAYMQLTYNMALAAGNARMQWALPDARWFDAVGWREREFRSYLEAGATLGRDLPFAWLGRLVADLGVPVVSERIRRLSGIALLERSVCDP